MTYTYHKIIHPNGMDYENWLAHESWHMYKDVIEPDQDSSNQPSTVLVPAGTSVLPVST